MVIAILYESLVITKKVQKKKRSDGKEYGSIYYNKTNKVKIVRGLVKLKTRQVSLLQPECHALCCLSLACSQP